MTSRQNTGNRGEALAARYLESRGHHVVRRNYRCPAGEIDLVVEGGEGLVFVEVRTRRQSGLMTPEETINRAKATRLVRSAEYFLAETGRAEEGWRVDLVAVELDSRDRLVRIEQIRDATGGMVAS